MSTNLEKKILHVIESSYVSFITSVEFKKQLKVAINTKLAKVLISDLGGEIERRVNELKRDPLTRAKITTAIDRVIKDAQKPRGKQ